MLHKKMENTLIKITLTPPYQVSRFIQATPDLIRYHTDTAFADASIISPVFKGTMVFLINSDGTVTVTLESNGGPEMNAFILEDYILDDLFENTPVIKYAGVTVLACNHFKTDSGEPLYIETNKPRPIDRLRDMINEGKMTQVPQEEPESPQETSVYEDSRPEPPSVNPMTGLFGGMLESAVKKNALKVREELDKTADELQKSDMDFERVAGNNHTLREKVENLKLRLDTLETTNESLNVNFSLTHITTTDSLSEPEKVLIKRVAKLLNVNEKYILHKLSENIFNITLYGDDVYKQEILSELYLSDPTGSFTPLQKKNTFEYRGSKEYNLLIQSMLKRGFTEKELETTSSDTSSDDMFPPIPGDMKPVHEGTYDNHTMVIIDFYGLPEEERAERGIELDDDFIDFHLFQNGVNTGSYQTTGFVNILPVRKYEELRSKLSEESLIELDNMGTHGVVVRNFTGDIGFLVYDRETKTYSNDFDIHEYITHQRGGDVCLVLSGRGEVTELDEKLMIPQTSYLG